MTARAIAYTRVSTGEQGVSGLGLEAQRHALELEAERRGWGRLGLVVEVASGAKLAGRPLLAQVLDALDAGEADLLVVSKLDRVARNLSDLLRIVERAQAHGWAFVALDLGIDTSTAAGAFTLSVMGAAAELERRLIADRTRAALAAKKARGHRLGRPSQLAPATLARIVERRAEGATLRTIAQELADAAIPTARGCGTWHAQQVAQALRTHALDLEAAEFRMAS